MKKEIVNTLVEKEITIEEMIESINNEANDNGTTLLKIIETFPKKGKDIHLVRTIEIETEDEFVMFSDCDEIIESNNLMIMYFLKESIVKVTKCHSDEEELDSYKMVFKDGTVEIQPLIW